MKTLLLASTATMLIAAPAFAQEEPADPAEETVIVVLGDGLAETPATPAYSHVEIEREQIVSSGSGRLEDVLSNVAGFQQFRRSDSRSANPTAQGATLRALGGNATSRALVLLDGVPMTDPFFGHIPFSAIAPERLGLIHVTRGGGSGPFGSGALAGTIELNSADASALGLFTGQVLANQREDTEMSASIAPEFGNGYAVFSGRWDRGDGFFTTPLADRVPATSRANFDDWSASGRLVQSLGPVELQLRGSAFETSRTLRFEGADSTTSGEDVSLRLVSRGSWQVDALAYAQWRNFSNIIVSSTRYVPVLDQKNTPAEGQGGKIEVRPPVGDDMTLRLGADFRRSAGDLFEDAYSAFSGNLTEERFAGGVNTNFGLFAENDIELGPVTLTGGLRADRYAIKDGYYRSFTGAGAPVRNDSYANRSDWEVTWRAGALVQANDVITFRAAAYTGLRLPTLNELYRPFVVFPVTTNANENLVPEKLEGYEVGADFAVDPGTRFSVTVFDNKVKNAIANVTIATNLRERQNLDAIDAFGVEFATSVQRGPWGFDASMALTNSEVRGTGFAAGLDGLTPSQTPKFSASATASYRADNGMNFAATLRHVSSQFEDDQETDVLPAATTVDLFAQMPVAGRLSAVARVENLFDETIVTRNQGGSMDIGVPQTVWLGLRYGF
ncbi:TonB-dependent receptor domain-containing protein [Alteraurantiacibacter aestuarii]|uniref:TonB-dependent receptor n=1 Tax=Alteraurantiacibacter aestuarii TaxID=650004 RepID=A0A844ZIX6_9SPHN|nr:TonB-dependent receptor [Alteraurantiacibacter aestuarii]MXO87393.1 TonB-dependent receptor [Alteraurantiacibacter aestuarii]